MRNWLFVLIVTLATPALAQAIPVPTSKPSPPKKVAEFTHDMCNYLKSREADYYAQQGADDAHYTALMALDVSDIVIPLAIPVSKYLANPDAYNVPMSDEMHVNLGVMKLDGGQVYVNDEPMSDEDVQAVCAELEKPNVGFGKVPAIGKVPAMQRAIPAFHKKHEGEK